MDEVTDELVSLDPSYDPHEYIKRKYPGLFSLICKNDAEVPDNSIELFRSYHQDPEQVSLYIHGCLLRQFALLRQSGRLKKGSKTVKIGDTTYDYEGELDANESCCGEGQLTDEQGH